MQPAWCHGHEWIPGLHRERLLHHPAQRQVLEQCLVWYDQVLMRARKVSGGLTRGRGITESTLAKWVCALPLCIPLCTAGEELAGSHTESSEQHSKASDHQDLRPAQQTCDQADLEQFIQWLEAHPPFSGHYGGELVSLSTGITGDSSVTCHNAKEVGQQLQQQMVGKSFADVKMNRRGKVKTLAAMTSSIVVHEQEVIVSPQQLFDRIICILDGSADLPFFLMYKLASFTLWSSLFAPYSKKQPSRHCWHHWCLPQ